MGPISGKLLRTEADWDEWAHWQTWQCGIDRWKGMIGHFRRDDLEAWALLREFVVLASDEPFLKWRWVWPSKIAMLVFRASFPQGYSGEYQHEHTRIWACPKGVIRLLYYRARPDFLRSHGSIAPEADEVWTGNPRGAIEFLRTRFEGGAG